MKEEKKTYPTPESFVTRTPPRKAGDPLGDYEESHPSYGTTKSTRDAAEVFTRRDRMKVSITQFLRPNGEQREVFTDVPDDCAVGYEALTRHHCRLTAEVLMTGQVSQTVEHEEGDYFIEITPNGPEVKEALVRMLRQFDGAKFAEWLKGMKGD